MGQKDIQRATFVLHNAAILLLVNGLLVTIVTLIFLDPILLFFGASHETLPYARDFMQVILMGNPIAFTFIAFVFSYSRSQCDCCAYIHFCLGLGNPRCGYGDGHSAIDRFGLGFGAFLE